MPTQGQPGSGGGKALAIGAGLLIGGLLLFGGSKSAGAATTKPSTDPCKELADNAMPVLAKATAADLKDLNDFLEAATLLNCKDLVILIGNKIKELTPPAVKPPPPKSGFKAENALDPVRAYNLAVAFSNAVPSPEWAKANPTRVAKSNGTYNTMYDYGADPGNVYSVKLFQTVSGLPGTGSVDSMTNAAFLYWLGHGGKRPDGSMDVRVMGEASETVQANVDPLCITCGAEMSPTVAGCSSCGQAAGMNKSQVEALRETRTEMAAETGFGGRGFGAAGIMGEKASVGGFFPARPFGGLRIVEPMPIIVGKPAYVTGDYDSGYKLGAEDVRRARTGALVYMSSFVATAGADYFAGYKAGVTASGGVLLGSLPGKIQVSLSADSGGGFGGGRAAGYGYVGSEASPAQTRALKSLEALRSKVSGELSGLIDAATTVIQQGKPINMLQIPVVPGSEPIVECLRSFDAEIRIAGEESKKATIDAHTEKEPASVFGSQFGRNQFGQGRR